MSLNKMTSILWNQIQGGPTLKSFVIFTCNLYFWANRNASKKRKHKSHEQEKQFMKSLKSVRATAVYSGDTEVTVEETSGEDDDSGDDLSDEEEEPEFASMEQLTGTSTSDSEEELDSLTPLFFLYDCEGTGGSVYTDHIVELAAVVQPLPDDIQIASPLQFQSLVYTAKRIAPVGKLVGSIFILLRKAVINCNVGVPLISNLENPVSKPNIIMNDLFSTD